MEPTHTFGTTNPVVARPALAPIETVGSTTPNSTSIYGNHGYDSDYEQSDDPAFQPDYGRTAAVIAGFKQTSIAMLYNAADAPAWPHQPGYLASTVVAQAEQDAGYEFTEEQREFLGGSVSPDDYNWRMGVLRDRDEDAKAASNHPVFYIAGALPDADILVGAGVGKIATAAKATRQAARAANIAATAGVIGGSYSYAATKLPVSTLDVAVNTLASSLGAMFLNIKGAPQLKVDNPIPVEDLVIKQGQP